MTVALSELAQRLLDAPTFVVLTTLNPDGGPQSSVIWAKRDGDALVFSTVLYRRKARNMLRDPRVSACCFDPAQPDRYVEIRGTVSLTEEGGRELIDELSRKYTGHGYPVEPPTNVRVVCRLTPVKVVSR